MGFTAYKRASLLRLPRARGSTAGLGLEARSGVKVGTAMHGWSPF